MRNTCASLPALLLCVGFLAGCVSTQVTQQTAMTEPNLPRPNQIWVYDFVAAPRDMPTDSSLAGRLGAPSTPLTAEEIETGRKYGGMIAERLVADIQNMGMPATLAGPGSAPQVGDAVIRGYIISTEGGNAKGFAKRFVIGFGAGATEMDTVVEGFAVTPQGLRKLGSGTLTSSGNSAPGMMLPAAAAIASGSPIGLIVVGGAKIIGATTGRSTLEGRANATADEIAAQLKIRFKDRGWIAQS